MLSRVVTTFNGNNRRPVYSRGKEQRMEESHFPAECDANQSYDE